MGELCINNRQVKGLTMRSYMLSKCIIYIKFRRQINQIIGDLFLLFKKIAMNFSFLSGTKPQCRWLMLVRKWVKRQSKVEIVLVSRSCSKSYVYRPSSFYYSFIVSLFHSLPFLYPQSRKLTAGKKRGNSAKEEICLHPLERMEVNVTEEAYLSYDNI